MSNGREWDLHSLASADPARNIDPDPRGSRGLRTKDQLDRRIAAERGQQVGRTTTARRGTRTTRRLVLVAAALLVSTAAVAVADRLPSDDLDEACQADGRMQPWPECGTMLIERALSEATENASAYQRQLLDDGRIERTEYDEAASLMSECLQDEYHEAAPAFQVTAYIEDFGLGPVYTWRIRYPASASVDDLPWEGEAPTMVEPMVSCRRDYFSYVDEVWRAQLIARPVD